MTAKSLIRVLMILSVVVSLSGNAFCQTRTIDGQSNCANFSRSNWVTVELGGAPTTITLSASDFSSSPGTVNAMAFVMLDGMDAGDGSDWLFSLNGVGDSRFVTAGRAFVGFLDTGLSDNSGGSTITFSNTAAGTWDETVDGISNCAEFARDSWIDVRFMHEPACMVELSASTFASSPGAQNPMAVVMLDGIHGATLNNFWLTTLNGIGDMLPNADVEGMFLGFLDTGSSDNSGTSQLSFTPCNVPNEVRSWGDLKALYR